MTCAGLVVADAEEEVVEAEEAEVAGEGATETLVVGNSVESTSVSMMLKVPTKHKGQSSSDIAVAAKSSFESHQHFCCFYLYVGFFRVRESCAALRTDALLG